MNELPTYSYAPLLMFAAIGAGFAVFSVIAGALAGPKRYNRAKLDAYECGIQPTPHAEGGGRVPIKYFLTAMMFIVFDVEALFLIPLAVGFDNLGLAALMAMVVFLFNAFFVLDIYVWRRGGLDWD